MRALWVHGLGEAAACFSSIVAHPALAALASVAPDLPGYGAAARPARPPSLIEVADGLAAELVGPTVVIGHSMGAVIGMHLAERHPGKVAWLFAVDGNVSLADCTFSSRIAAYPAETFARDGLPGLLAYLDERARHEAPLAGYARHMRLADPATLHRHAAELVDLSTTETIAARLAALPVPVTYLAGAPGGASPRSRALLAAAAVDTLEIAPAGHWPFLDQPDAFAAALATRLAT